MNHISTDVRIASQWGKEHESPAICVISRFSTKSIVFQKEFLNVFSIKKGKLHLTAMNCNELSNLYWIVLVISFFPLLLWITAESRTKLMKLFIWTTKSSGTQHQKQTNCTWLFISNCNNVSDILDWTWFLHYFWLQGFIQEQT